MSLPPHPDACTLPHHPPHRAPRTRPATRPRAEQPARLRPAGGRPGRHFETLIDGALAKPSASLSALPLLGAGERFQLLAEWNDTEAPARAEPARGPHPFR